MARLRQPWILPSRPCLSSTEPVCSYTELIIFMTMRGVLYLRNYYCCQKLKLLILPY